MSETKDTRLGVANDPNFALRLYIRDIVDMPRITPEEEVELAIKIKAGDMEARTRMIEANLRLVIKIAKDYENYGLPFLDLINEGNMGLMKAVDRFDPTKGAKLSTYAAWWIKQSIKRALANQGKTIRIPVHLVALHRNLKKIETQLSIRLDREPDHSEIALEAHVTEEKVTMVFDAAQSCTSLNALIGDSDVDSFLDVTEDEGARMPFEDIESSDLLGLLRKHLSMLEERDRRILTMRFGLDGSDPIILDDVGRVYGVTRERIRQIQAATLKKLRDAIDADNAVQDPDQERFVAEKARAFTG